MAGRLVSMVALVVLVVACSASGSSSSPAAPSVTGAIPSGASPSVEAPASSAAETWDLLWVSDSTASGGTPWLYADHIRADLGVEVEVTDGWTPGLSAFSILDTLRGRNDGQLRAYSGTIDLAAAVRDAEVIVVSGNPGSSLPADHVPCAIAYEPNPTCDPPVQACSAGVWTTYEEHLGEIYDEIFALRDGAPVVLRTHDWYLPWGPMAVWEACDCVEVCLECNRQFSASIHRVAAEHGVPVAEYLTTFSGPNGDQPMPREWTPDGVHPTVATSEKLIETMLALGYEAVAPRAP